MKWKLRFRMLEKPAIFLLVSCLLIAQGNAAISGSRDDLEAALKNAGIKELHRQLDRLAKMNLSEKDALRVAKLVHDRGVVNMAIHFLELRAKQQEAGIPTTAYLAQLQVEVNALDEALKTYDRLCRMAPDSLQYWLRYGETALWKDRPDLATTAYTHALQLAPADTMVLGRLRQLFLWQEELEKAYAIEKRMLEIAPNQPELWKAHARHARWLERPQEALPALKVYLKMRPQDLEAWIWLGEGYLWSGQTERAERVFRYVLKRQPDHLQAQLYLAQAMQWHPIRWWQARNLFRHVLQTDPSRKEARQALQQIREAYGPQLFTNAYYLTDSNHLEKLRVDGKFDRYISGRWKVSLGTYFYQLAEDKSSGRILVQGQAARLQAAAALSEHTGLTFTVGGLQLLSGESFALLELRGNYHQPGLRFDAFLRSEPVEDGVLALKNRWIARRAGAAFYFRPRERFYLTGEGHYGAYSDANRKLHLYLDSRFRLAGRFPALYLQAIYGYENMKIFYPDAEPYWTPRRFWSRSLGAFLQFRRGDDRLLRLGYLLTQQPGNETAGNGYVEFDWRLSRFTYVHLAYHNYGSQYYAYKAMEFGFRWRL